MKGGTALDRLVADARLQAQTGVYDGTNATADYFLRCRHIYRPMTASVIFTRDAGHHESGWWKNPEYERCFHLSVAFADGFARKKGEILARAFFGGDAKYLWLEPPYSMEGKRIEVWHYRLFCDENWDGIKPAGEVYSRKMPAGWMSFSERHGRSGSGVKGSMPA